MASLKILIYKNEVIACHRHRKMLQNFIDQFELTGYEIDKIQYDKITPEQEYSVSTKEIYYDEHYGVYANDDIYGEIVVALEGIAEQFGEVDSMIDEMLEYIKFTEDEQDDVCLLSSMVNDIVMDIVGCDESSEPMSLFGDYFDIEAVIKELLHGIIVIS